MRGLACLLTLAFASSAAAAEPVVPVEPVVPAEPAVADEGEEVAAPDPSGGWPRQVQRGEASCLQYFDGTGALVERCPDGSKLVMLTPSAARPLLEGGAHPEADATAPEGSQPADAALAQAGVFAYAPWKRLEVAARAEYGRYERADVADPVTVDQLTAEISVGADLAEAWLVDGFLNFRYARLQRRDDDYGAMGVLIGAEALRFGPPMTPTRRSPVPFLGGRAGIAQDAGYLRPAFGAVAGLRVPFGRNVQAETRVQVLSTLPTGSHSDESSIRFEVGLSLGLVLSVPLIGGGA